MAVRHNGGEVNYLLGDHLGSTSLTTGPSGALITELRYFPYGGGLSFAEQRYNPAKQVTTFRYTGQRWDSGTGLYYYGARWYDASLARFISADTIIPQPGNPQALNRYNYVLNNPLRYTDPSGHEPEPPTCKGEDECERLQRSAQHRRRARAVRNTAIVAGAIAKAYVSARVEDAIPDVYFKGASGSGAIPQGYSKSVGMQEVWDFKNMTHAIVSNLGEGMALPGISLMAEVGFAEYGSVLSNGNSATFERSYLGDSDEYSLGWGVPVEGIPLSFAVTDGNSAAYVLPGQQIHTQSLQIGVGSPGPSGGYMHSYTEALNIAGNEQIDKYQSRGEMARAIVRQHLAGGLSPINVFDTLGMVGLVYTQ